MTFECQRCGDCCSTMGEIISIREQVRGSAFRIAYTTGEERIVTIDPDKRDLFGIFPEGESRSLACPFLQLRAEHERICTVHASRPELCRNYLCSRILILNHEGKKAGRVMHGTRYFIPEDHTVLEIWNRCLKDIPVSDERDWENNVEQVFTDAGYRVIR